MITGNEPAMPLKEVGFNAETGKVSFDTRSADFKINFTGLTIREYFAAMAMASDDYDVPYIEAYEGRAKYWVAKADALIAELNK